ncbi:MAG: tetratricopeptide repeat protein [Bacteroidota bacterium]|jgi:tetratricopeptide (TPR) repeat protein
MSYRTGLCKALIFRVKQVITHTAFIGVAVCLFLCFKTNDLFAQSDAQKYSLEYNKAKQYLTSGKQKKAIKKLKKLVYKNTSNYEAALLLAHIYENENNYAEAAVLYSVAIKNKPKDALLYFSRGNCYFAIKKYHLAVSDYNTTIRYDSLFLGAYNNMALARIFNQGSNQTEIREEDFRIARDNIKKFEEKAAIGDQKVLQNLGLIYLYLFDFKTSQEYFNRVLHNDSTSANAYFYAGLANYYLRNFKEALILFKKAEQYAYENKNQLEEFITFTTFVIEQMNLPENTNNDNSPKRK